MIDDLLDVARIASGKAPARDAARRPARRGARGVDVVAPSARAKQIEIRTQPRRAGPASAGRSAAPPADRLEPALERGEIHRARRARRGAGDARPGGCSASSSPTPDTASAPSFCRSSSSGSGKATAPAPGVTAAWASGSRSSGELVELHGGHVSVESAGERRGAAFTVDLPTAMSPDVRFSAPPRPARARGHTPSLAGLRVLIVEDEADFRDLLGAVLSRCGAETIMVPSCGSAIAVLRDSARRYRT